MLPSESAKPYLSFLSPLPSNITRIRLSPNYTSSKIIFPKINLNYSYETNKDKNPSAPSLLISPEQSFAKPLPNLMSPKFDNKSKFFEPQPKQIRLQTIGIFPKLLKKDISDTSRLIKTLNSLSSEKLLSFITRQIIGRNIIIHTIFGSKLKLYIRE